MKTFAIILACVASGCLAARIETITLDLERPQQPFTLTLTEATDSTVSAQLRASGSEFDPTGWTGLLWYGASNGGQTLTNSTAGYGAMTWSVPVSAMPTNGRYSVQILGAISNRVEEWGRGAMVVRINPSRDFLPPQWATNTPAYAAALQALSGLADHVVAINPHNVTAEQIGAATFYDLSWALVTNRVALLYGTNQWIDGDGGVWRVNYVPAGWRLTVANAPLFTHVFPNIPSPLTVYNEYYGDNYIGFNPDPNGNDGFEAYLAVGPATWLSRGNISADSTIVIMTPESDEGRAFDNAVLTLQYASVTSRVDKVATEVFVAAAMLNAPPQTLTSTDGVLRWDAGFSKWYRTILTNGYELYFEVTP